MPTSNKNSHGFTLIEVMVAILIMMVGLLGLLQSINVASEATLRNQLREEAVHVGERLLNQMRGEGFDAVAAVYPLMSTPSRIRGVDMKLYAELSSTTLAADTKLLNVAVRWTYKGVTYVNRVSAPISKVPE